MEKYINSKTKEEISILNMYELVFEDAVKCYLADINYEEKKLSLSEDDIKNIAYRLIYKNEYVWKIINECIKSEIEYLKECK